jgi:hypothetical protein
MRHDFSIDARGLRMRRALVALGEAVARYTRFEFDEGAGKAEGAALYAVNHGLGSANVLLAACVGARIGLRPEQPSVLLMHQLAWSLGVPAKMRGTVCRPFQPSPGDAPEDVPRKVEAEMDATAQRLAAGRNPYLDWLTRPGRWKLRAEEALA